MKDPTTPSGGPRSVLRRKLLLGSAAMALAAMVPSIGWAQSPPTAEVNTTDLAVTDDTVTVGILHSVTGKIGRAHV